VSTLPTAFRAQRTLAWLNVAAVGLALAAATASLVDPGGTRDSLHLFVPTAILGSFWAWMLRKPSTISLFGKKRRVGWVVSPILAATNAAAIGAAVLYESRNPFETIAGGALIGATFGALLWIPALLLTLLFFGLPIARAQRLAERGLSGEERGEITVGVVCFAIAALAVAVSPSVPIVGVGGAVGGLAGATAAALAVARTRRRRAFVAAAESGTLAGFRVEETQEGKVLLRVAEQKSYRVADFEEEMFDLDAEGEAVRPKATLAR
jgi:hypothetical protein